MTECGHYFCRLCIKDRRRKNDYSCPTCGRESRDVFLCDQDGPAAGQVAGTPTTSHGYGAKSYQQNAPPQATYSAQRQHTTVTSAQYTPAAAPPGPAYPPTYSPAPHVTPQTGVSVQVSILNQSAPQYFQQPMPTQQVTSNTYQHHQSAPPARLPAPYQPPVPKQIAPSHYSTEPFGRSWSKDMFLTIDPYRMVDAMNSKAEHLERASESFQSYRPYKRLLRRVTERWELILDQNLGLNLSEQDFMCMLDAEMRTGAEEAGHDMSNGLPYDVWKFFYEVAVAGRRVG